MKNINKILSLAFVAAITAFTFTSCEDEDKFRIPALGNGGFIKFVSLPEFDAGAEATSANFVATVEDPNQNAANFALTVIGDFTGAPADTLVFKSTTTFPFDVSFTGADMASLFEVPISTFEEGDSFEFLGTVTTTDGRVYDISRPGGEFPSDPEDPDYVPGTYNGGLTDGVLLDAPGLLSALNYEVTFDDAEE
ncbi:hypothetical protein [Patiriisocius sp. Uisw_017]|uniref:hypothetical protein n=1 Tax=Patiriisocius sp. Uisw_017 TaxID=3230968 RepID=UPI0039E74718